MSAPSPPPPRLSRGRRISRAMHLYIGGEILKSFLLVMAVFEVVLGSIFCFGAVKDYGIDLGILIPILGPALAAYLNPAIPVSLLFSTALVYGRLIADREAAALKSFGFSYLELSLTPAVLGAGMAVVMLVLNFWAIPELRFTRDNLGGLILDRLRYLGEGSNQSFNFGKYTIWIEEIRGNRLEGIFIAAEEGSSLGLEGLERPEQKELAMAPSYPLFFYAAKGEVVSEPAAKGKGKDLAIELRDVTLYYDAEYRKGKFPADHPELKDFRQRLDLSRFPLPVRIEKERPNQKEMTYPILKAKIAELERQFRRAKPGTPAHTEVRRQYFGALAEHHRRISFAVVALAFPLAAAALSLLLNSPNKLLPVFVTLMVATPAFFLLEMWGFNVGKDGHLPWLFAQMGNAGLLALAAACFLVMRRRTLW